MERNPTLTFMSGTPPAEVPITDLTVNDIRLVCVEGTYSGSVIYPDNVETPHFSNLGNGQYGIGYFNHANFKSAIGSGYTYYVKVQRKIAGTWTDQYQFGVFRIGDENEVMNYLVGVETAARIAADATLMSLASNQNVNSIKNFLQNIFVPVATENGHAVPLSQLNSAIAGVAVTPHQYGSQYREVITDGVEQTDKVYTTIANAIGSLVPTAAKRCAVVIKSTGTGGKTLLSHLSMVDYVDIIGERKFNLQLGASGASVSKNMTFKNLNIYMGNYDIVGARVYTGITFEDCNIYSFQNLTLTNCILTNTKVYQGSGKNVTPTGNCEIVGGGFTQPLITPEGMTGFIASDDNLSPSYSMPADPTNPA